ncbi:MAG: serine--tRNA ligase [Planctomycetota bacterium]|nr:serine--tRNA ligase [Planctomycetota bacterium]MDA1106483.1 serine--tRNA ligase [Planctomycetota bacterium]
MIDIKAYRETPARFQAGAGAKRIIIDFGRLDALDAERRRLVTGIETRKADQNRLSKEIGPQLGQLKGRLKGLLEGSPGRAEVQGQLAGLEAAPLALKNQIAVLEAELRRIEPEWESILMTVPQPPASDVPVGASSDDNVELRRWAPAGFDPARGFAACRGFAPRTHLDLVKSLKLADFERGVKMSGTRHYILTGWGMRLQQAVLRMAFDMMTNENGFTPIGVPVIVQEQCMVGTGFFPAGREQAYHIEESRRGAGHDLFLTGTGEVGLMGIHAGEILHEADLPIRYTTVSTCFRREAGAAGKDTAGLYRIHQFEKVEQVVVCRADDAESRQWHQTMIGFVESLLQRMELPYRLLQCCTGDLGVKNEDMIDIECWMPGRGEVDVGGVPQGAWGETHSASRLADFQTRRLNVRYRDSNGKLHFPYALNNTVCASPRILIPLVEIHQQADGSVRIPEALRPYLGGATEIRA